MPDSGPSNIYVHNHGIYETCSKQCPANDWWNRPGGDNARVFYSPAEANKWISTTYPGPKQNATPSPAEDFEPEDWYPNAPLTSNEKAFLWYGSDSTGTSGDVLEDSSHWKIIDKVTKRNVYDFLKESETTNIPMLWGYVVFMPNAKMYVKFLTHMNPGKQDLEYMQPAIKDLEKHFHRDVVDYDQEDTHTPVLESYTPSFETSGFQGTDPPIMGKPSQPEPETMPDADEIAGEFKTIRQDVLNDGVKVSTVFLGKMSPIPEQPFETLVFHTEDTTGKTLEVDYSSTQDEALAEHYRLVDKYNRLALDDESSSTDSYKPVGRLIEIRPGVMRDEIGREFNAHIQITAYFNDAGILATEVHPEQLEMLPRQHHGLNAVEVNPGPEASHENGEKPFMYHEPSNTLFYTTHESHHVNIIPVINRYLQERGHDYNGPWVTGDITSPQFENRNWIKFIGSDSGHYPESVINYLQQKFGPDRDLMHSGEGDWEEMPESYIQRG